MKKEYALKNKEYLKKKKKEYVLKNKKWIREKKKERVRYYNKTRPKFKLKEYLRNRVREMFLRSFLDNGFFTFSITVTNSSFHASGHSPFFKI